MQYVLGSIVAMAMMALAIGAITGRVKVRSCCAPADPAQDLRMQMDVPDRDIEGPRTTPTIEATSTMPGADGPATSTRRD